MPSSSPVATCPFTYGFALCTCPPGIQIKEEPDSEEWQLSGDSTLNPSDLNNLRVQMGDDDMDAPSGEGKRLRRVACTCPNCKESGGR